MLVLANYVHQDCRTNIYKPISPPPPGLEKKKKKKSEPPNDKLQGQTTQLHPITSPEAWQKQGNMEENDSLGKNGCANEDLNMPCSANHSTARALVIQSYNQTCRTNCSHPELSVNTCYHADCHNVISGTAGQRRLRASCGHVTSDTRHRGKGTWDANRRTYAKTHSHVSSTAKAQKKPRTRTLTQRDTLHPGQMTFCEQPTILVCSTWVQVYDCCWAGSWRERICDVFCHWAACGLNP